MGAPAPQRPERPALLSLVNWPFVLVVALLVGYGLLVCWSAVYGDEKYSFNRQLAGVGVGVVLMVLLWHFDYRRLANMTTALLVINVVLILSPHLPVIGVNAKGEIGRASCRERVY